jgi:hypothetical protein
MPMVVRSLGSSTVVMEKSHKASWTAAAVYASLPLLATAWIPVSRDGYRALRRFARLRPTPAGRLNAQPGLGQRPRRQRTALRESTPCFK